MDSRDRQELIRLAEENIQLQRMLERHERLKERIRTIRKRGILTVGEEQEVQALKLQKLRGKDEMLRTARVLNKTPRTIPQHSAA